MGTVEYQFKVCWGDTDAAGIVFYPNFYKWMDQASHHFFSTLGYPTSKLFKEKIGLPVIEAKCQFQYPLLFDDEVCIQSSIGELHDKAFKIQHEFLKEGIKIAEGYEIRIWASFHDKKPKAVSIPEEVKQKMMETQISV
jgi:4-hydroxybenzoyl-CoA thioesterase